MCGSVLHMYVIHLSHVCVCICMCKCHSASTCHKSLNTPHQYNIASHLLLVFFKVSPSTHLPQRPPSVYTYVWVCSYLPLAKAHDLFYNFSIDSCMHVYVWHFNEYWMIWDMGRILLSFACILMGKYIWMCVCVCLCL